MKIRDAHATLNGDNTEVEMPSGALQIVADDKRTLFEIVLLKDGGIQVRGGHYCKHSNMVLDNAPLSVRPIASNAVEVRRPIVQ